MSETAQHKIDGQDSSLEAIEALSALDLKQLSFVQLKRLQKILERASDDIQAESRRRADTDSSGDTVKVPSPNL